MKAKTIARHVVWTLAVALGVSLYALALHWTATH